MERFCCFIQSKSCELYKAAFVITVNWATKGAASLIIYAHQSYSNTGIILLARLQVFRLWWLNTGLCSSTSGLNFQLEFFTLRSRGRHLKGATYQSAAFLEKTAFCLAGFKKCGILIYSAL